MKKLMILGASYSQMPLIQAAKRLGIYTIVCSTPGSWPGFAEADECSYTDISDPQAVLAEARRTQIQGITTCCLDTGVPAIGTVCEAMGLTGPKAIPAQTASDKWKMKEAFVKAGVQTARHIRVRSEEELEAALAAASAELSNVHAELKAVESTLREKKDLQKQLLAYIKTKPARDGLRAQKTEKARRAYREQHESEFIISESAARYFKAQGISKLPASKALQTEIEQLTKEKNALYNEYREKKANVRELQTVKSNLDKILRREPERGKGRENER